MTDFLRIRRLLIFNIDLSTDTAIATLGTPEQILRHDLLANYHHDVRPVLKPGDVINITFSYKLGRIVSLVSRGCLVPFPP